MLLELDAGLVELDAGLADAARLPFVQQIAGPADVVVVARSWKQAPKVSRLCMTSRRRGQLS
jgi:hypothetical protein